MVWFDTQASGFDARAGIGDDAARAVATALADWAGAAPVLEIGAGTGEIGAHLARYAGMDLSWPMLAEFRRRSPASLIQADADGPWPVRPASVGLVFASRAAHLLDRRHFLAELTRAVRPGGLFVLGRVRRDPGGLREALRRRRRALLAEHGAPAGGEGGERGRRLLEELVQRGASPEPARTVARWAVVTDPARVVENWRTGGKPMPDAVLADLQAWATQSPATEEETYTLDAVRLP